MRLPMNFDGAIFDLDGTLFDSMTLWEDIDKDFLASRSLKYTPDYSQALLGLDILSSARYTISRYGLLETPEELIDIWNRMARDAYENTVELKPGAKALLSDLKKHNVRLAVATALDPVLFEPCLKRHGIYDWFDCFCFCGETGCPKNSPDIYLLAAKRLGVEPNNCVVFEDITAGLLSAKSGGFHTVAVFDKAPRNDWEQIRSCADTSLVFDGKTIHSFSSLIESL